MPVYIKIIVSYPCILIANFGVVCHSRQLAILHSLTGFRPSGLSNQIFKFQESLRQAKARELLSCLLWPWSNSFSGSLLPGRLENCW